MVRRHRYDHIYSRLTYYANLGSQAACERNAFRLCSLGGDRLTLILLSPQVSVCLGQKGEPLADKHRRQLRKGVISITI
jgi:hypothetical protein